MGRECERAGVEKIKQIASSGVETTLFFSPGYLGRMGLKLSNDWSLHFFPSPKCLCTRIWNGVITTCSIRSLFHYHFSMSEDIK